MAGSVKGNLEVEKCCRAKTAGRAWLSAMIPTLWVSEVRPSRAP